MKNDIQMKRILETFDNTLKAVEVQRKEFEDANARLTDMINNFEASIVSKVLETLKSTRHTRQQVVAFSVRDLQNKTPKKGETMIYNTVIQNVGGAFDPDSGKFTAPVDAVYLFAVKVSTSTNNWGRVKIVLNGREVHSISKYNSAAPTSYFFFWDYYPTTDCWGNKTITTETRMSMAVYTAGTSSLGYRFRLART